MCRQPSAGSATLGSGGEKEEPPPPFGIDAVALSRAERTASASSGPSGVGTPPGRRRRSDGFIEVVFFERESFDGVRKRSEETSLLFYSFYCLSSIFTSADAGDA